MDHICAFSIPSDSVGIHMDPKASSGDRKKNI